MILRWKDKRGFTLVEMIIAMAILSIVSLTVMMLMTYGTRSYSYAKSELDLQMESQTLLAQLNTMIMESNYAEYDSSNHVLILYQIEEELPTVTAAPGATATPPAGKVKRIKKVKNMKLIKFDAAGTKNLYLQDSNTEVLKPASGGALTWPQDELFAEYMDSFDVKIDGSNVTISLSMKSGKRTYSVDATSKIRNRLIPYP